METKLLRDKHNIFPYVQDRGPLFSYDTVNILWFSLHF